MASTRDIRRRIKSVKNTAQITKAMQMVAASKMRKAQQAALAGRPYANLMNKVLGALVAEAKDFSHPFLQVRDNPVRGVILVGTDKGLCGSLNSNLMREAAKFEAEAVFVAAGRKGAQYLARTKRKVLGEVEHCMYTDFLLQFFQVQPLGPDFAFVTYESSMQFPKGSPLRFRRVFIGELWTRQSGDWKMMRYQETLVR